MENKYLELPSTLVENLKVTDLEASQVLKQIESLQRLVTGLSLYKNAVITEYLQKNKIENAIELTEDYKLKLKVEDATEVEV